jgi:DNA-binding transcriptional LysR family regulator
MVPVPKLFTFLDVVARAGSIRRAAEILNVASTAINRKILEVERDIGTPLFERLPRGVRLTSAGEILIAAVRRNLSELSSVESQIEQLKGLVRGRVRIACSESVSEDLVPSVIASYQANYPGVQFHVRMGGRAEIIEQLVSYETDLALVHDPLPSDAVAELAVCKQTLYAMMRPDHPLAGKSKLRVVDLQNYPVAIGEESFISRQSIDQVVRKAKVRLNVALEANSVRTLKAFARETGAICFQFEIGTRRERATKEMVAVPLIDRDLPGSRLVLASRTGRSLPIAALSFIERIKLELLTKA